jgi:hypothetical protein
MNVPTSPQTLILAVPGTQETRELDFQSVRDAVARGEIALDNWAWCPSHNNWLPLAQLPEFASTTEVYEEPVPVQPVVPVRVEPMVVQVPKVAAAPVVPVRAAAPVVGTPNRLPATYYSKPVEESHEFPIFKVLFVVLALAVGTVLGGNYYLVDQPYQQSLAQTRYASLQTHAHLAAFVQPDALLIHVFPSPQINGKNFTDVLSALAKSTPSQAFAGKPFTSVSLTSFWRGQYMMSLTDWKGLSGSPADQQKDYLLSHIETISGAPLVPFVPRESNEAHTARVAGIWDALVASFVAKTP